MAKEAFRPQAENPQALNTSWRLIRSRQATETRGPAAALLKRGASINNFFRALQALLSRASETGSVYGFAAAILRFAGGGTSQLAKQWA